MAKKKTTDKTKIGGKTAYCKNCPYNYNYCPYEGLGGSLQLEYCPFAKQCLQIDEHIQAVDVDKEFKGFNLDNWIKERLN